MHLPLDLNRRMRSSNLLSRKQKGQENGSFRRSSI